MSLIQDLKWRYATKKMDSAKRVSKKDMDYIKEAIRLSASSYGLQPYTILEIGDSELRTRLRPLCWGQNQIVEASHLLIFCNHVSVSDEEVDDFIHLKASTNDLTMEKVSGYGTFVKGKLKEKSTEEIFHWTSKQTYIALANALVACAELKIDSTPMEGFETDRVNALLNLPTQGLNACVILAIGYRQEEDVAQHSKKVRKPVNSLFQA